MRLLLIRMTRFTRSAFWRDASALDESATAAVLPGVLLFGGIAAAISLIDWLTPRSFHFYLDVSPFEFGGAVLGLLLVLRTNEGIGRWWEARKLWGGITNQSRNLAASSLAYGPADPAWRRALVVWTIAFGHACRATLRQSRELPEIEALLGPDETTRLAGAEHMPTAVSARLAAILRLGVDRLGLDRYVFLGLDRERMSLIDHLGGCERILKTPLPRAYSVQIRRFMFFFLAILPFGMIPKVGWLLTPLITMLVAYPVLSLDRIGADLQFPFGTTTLNHLDLDAYTANIERNLLALLDGNPNAEELVVIALDEAEGSETPA